MKRIEPAHLHGAINGLTVSSSSPKQMRQTADSDLHDFLGSSILSISTALSFTFFCEGAFVIARAMIRAAPVPFIIAS
jgi:hypothetical protein